MKKVIYFLFISLLFACSGLKTSSYDQFAYQKTVEIKVDAENLMDKSSEDFSNHEKEVEALKKEMAFMKEYEKNRPNDQISYAMWQLVSDPSKNSLMGFLEFWKKNKKVSPAFSTEAKQQIDEALSLLLKYEAAKNKGTEDSLMNYINLKN